MLARAVCIIAATSLWASLAFAQNDAPTEGADGLSRPPSDGSAPAPEEKADESAIDLTQADRIRAVSRKTFLKRGRFEATPFIGASTNDAFFQHWNGGLRLSYHIVDSLSVDVGGGFNFLTLELPSVEIVKRQQSAIPDEAVLFGNLDAGFTFSPIYGKFAILDDWILHFDGFMSGGLGVVVDSNRYAFFGQTLPEFLPGVNPAVELGIGGRVFVTDWLVIRADVRDYFYPQWRSGISTLQNLLYFNVGLAIYFPFGFEYEYVAAKVVEG